ncbi:hypothetical protein B5X24_HaOG204297 [Helicoverpa armigera]|uniref:Uncharacterized protein n=1 Tax=Helicoverpa armigera TaxID=29058 RepID=A0A2W1BNR0_HELAM|nr:hypothetical protein B5X24_HaOG204297 [Helicoverpa armigera]
MERAAAELPPRAGASPGLLRRRYSVPETIMRKYRLAQQRSESEESAPASNRSGASASPCRDGSGSPTEPAQRFLRRDRELMRRSALMRRMWGRGAEPCRSCCCCAPGARETRSLDGSRSELRALSSLASSRHSPGAGWASPKRQRLDSSRDFRGSDEMLRAAMKNSYDRAEESRHDRDTRADFSDSTYRSHDHEPSLYAEKANNMFTDSDGSKFHVMAARNAFVEYSDQQSSDMTTMELKSSTADDVPVSSKESAQSPVSDERSLSDSSETYSASYPTAKEGRLDELVARSGHCAGVVSESGLHRDDNDAVPYDKPLAVHTPSYEVLEIVVSETLNLSAAPTIGTLSPDKPAHCSRPPTLSQKNAHNINIDEYVSNILVESLNSLTDQLECMNASMGNERKISIVEKEIKVKLQNTGVNTIVHLSPTSNNQIIFGNEELCINEEDKDDCNNKTDASALAIRDELPSAESNNNRASSPGGFDLQHDAVNQAVLHQIQKLFRDELHQSPPEISHIEISNVTDVFINNDNEPSRTDAEGGARYELISGVGTGSYYPDADDNPVVPRFSAFPHTQSMEVNTSSSDDADLMGSDCTSLVDSLDDPNSPRSVLLRRALSTRRSELVRSAIDVLDLLPENAANNEVYTPKDKGESFFIQITDNECDCDKENVNVADRMPEKIKQRLYRRHRKREMRMECARRSRGKQRARDGERAARRDGERAARRDGERAARRDVTRDCLAIVNALIDDVIAKVAQDEYKCMRIKHRPNRMVTSKSDDNVAKRTWKKQLEPINDRDPFKSSKNNSRLDVIDLGKQKSERQQIHGKLSLMTRPTDDRTAKRIYQKSEIHDGNKCIEILEILEYVNGSQSSPETTNSDENQNLSMKNKKSRIPIPIYEKMQRYTSSDSNKNSKRSSLPRTEHGSNANRLITDMLLGALASPPSTSPPASAPASPTPAAPASPPRRASLPEPRSRSNSLRFKQTFDIIPEERSSLSLDSGNEDLNHNRRASAPDPPNQSHHTQPYDVPSAHLAMGTYSPPHKLKPREDLSGRCKDMKSAGTSPMTDSDGEKRFRSKNQITMTSPGSKSAATSPMRLSISEAGTKADVEPSSKRTAARGRGCTPAPRRDAGDKERAESDSVRLRRSMSTQYSRECAQEPRRSERPERLERPPRPAPRRPPRSPDERSARSHDDTAHNLGEKRKSRSFSLDRSDAAGVHSSPVKLPEFKEGGGSGGATSSDSSESGGSLLCSLAPRWLAQGRARRHARRRPPAPAADSPPPGGWSVTVAGSCRAALPADVEMRLRFPNDARASAPVPCQECTCRHCATCACGARPPAPPAAAALPPAPPHPPPHPLARADSKLTLTMKKEALDSSILASKSRKKSGSPLPDVETYRASRSKLRSSVKTRRGYSLHCWLPDDEAAPLRYPHASDASPSDPLSPNSQGGT